MKERSVSMRCLLVWLVQIRVKVGLKVAFQRIVVRILLKNVFIWRLVVKKIWQLVNSYWLKKLVELGFSSGEWFKIGLRLVQNWFQIGLSSGEWFKIGLKLV